MKSNLFFIVLFLLICTSHLFAQDIHYTKNGKIAFYSKAPLENIEAHNNEVVSYVDVKKNEIAFSLLIKGFHFEKALMEEHFNTTYLESDKYPKATFNGKIIDAGNLKSIVDGSYPVKASGTLTIHGISKEITVDALVNIRDKKLSAHSTFKVHLSDFKIKIPSVVSQNIAEVVDVTVDCN